MCQLCGLLGPGFTFAVAETSAAHSANQSVSHSAGECDKWVDNMGKVTVTDREFFNLELISDHISQAVGTETRELRHKKKIDL